MRPNGFTEFILDEAMILQDRLNSNTPTVYNHLAWPQYVSEHDVVAWRARYSNVMETVEYSPPSDVVDSIDPAIFLPPDCPENAYIWSRCLTQMRELSINDSDTRICVGGRFSNYKGRMPGVLEEILLALKSEKPLYLLGGFGGITQAITEVILNKKAHDKISSTWQIEHTTGYSDLQQLAKNFENEVNYSTIIDELISTNISTLAERSGLDVDDYTSLISSPFIDECIHLVMKGLKSLDGTPN